ncbi:hypothetical protein B825_03838, partial [Acinetobacter baumannii ZWS1122]
THVRVSHRQLIILNTPNQWLGVFFYIKKAIRKELFQRIIDTKE